MSNVKLHHTALTKGYVSVKKVMESKRTTAAYMGKGTQSNP